ncbi:hypothetical protein P261_01051 [Lachnospiraceae bacterium TWA4]|nr:hypothetical protein P261_01051 [Lachnospiraceae bacterium TWA4]
MKIIKVIINLLIPFGLFVCLENFTHSILITAPLSQVFNYCIFLIAGLLLTTLFGNTMFAAIILSILTLIVGAANYFVLSFRGNPILPWDIASINTALSVADNYKFEINSSFIISVIGIIVLLLFGIIFRIKCKRQLIIALFCCLALIGSKSLLGNETFTDHTLKFTNLFTQWASYRDNGFVVSFLQNLKYLDIDAPNGYDSSTLKNELPFSAPLETKKPPTLLLL